MRLAFVGGFAFSPKGTIRARAHPLAKELVRRGHEVTIFLPPYDNVADSGREWHQDGVRIVNVGVSDSMFSYPQALAALIQAVDKYDPDLIHVFKPKGFAGAAATYWLLRNRKLVLDCDDWEGWGGWNDVKPYPWMVKEYIDRQECWLVRHASAVTVASRELQKRVVALRGETDKVYYVPNCASSNISELKRQIRQRPQSETRTILGLPQGLMILYSGHFEAGEDSAFFCESVAPVAEKHRAFVVFVGQGPEIRKVREFFDRTHVKALHFPELPYEDFLRVVWAADVTAFPYPDNSVHRSKCSARIIDYMSMGKPVVTSAVGQNHEYIVNGESGILVEANNLEYFSAKLDALLSDSQLRRRLGENAEKRIDDNFQWQGAAVGEVLAAYRAALPGLKVIPISAADSKIKKSSAYANDSVSHRVPR